MYLTRSTLQDLYCIIFNYSAGENVPVAMEARGLSPSPWNLTSASPGHIFTTCFSNFSFNIIIPSMPRSPNWFLFLRFSSTFLCIFLVFAMFCLYHFSLKSLRNVRLRIHTWNFSVFIFLHTTVAFCFIYPYSAQYFVLRCQYLGMSVGVNIDSAYW